MAHLFYLKPRRHDLLNGLLCNVVAMKMIHQFLESKQEIGLTFRI